jgi:YrbI family 3-deoxy-D-manno-octulosonate 8-phosphate phosphatase
MKTVALIPVRGGSKSIPGKNIKPLAGRPLLHWALEAAANSKRIDAVYVSSDDPEIRSAALAYRHAKVHAIDRPPETATDHASTESVMLDFAERYEFDRLVLIQATSPLTTTNDIDGALELIDATQADSLVTVTHEHRFRWRDEGGNLAVPQNYDPVRRPRRQDWNGELVENGSFYICSRTGLIQTQSRLHGKIAFWKMSGKTAVEIDNPEDWEILEAIMGGRGASRKNPQFDASALKLLITDVDGVLTDAGMYYGPSGDALKKFNTRDGMGAEIWRKSGRKLAIVTGESSDIVLRRAEKLGIEHVRLGAKDKLAVVQDLLKELELDFSSVAYIGDDLNDFDVMKKVAFAACPADAHHRIRELAHFTCRTNGGGGCLRELVELLLA